MSSEDSDSDVQELNLPSATECEERCQRFAEVTGTDTALAMFFLQDREWNLDRALNAFFEQNPGAGAGAGAAGTGASKEGSSSADTASGQPQSKDSGSAVPDPQPHRIRVLSWNIDGLSAAHLKQRTKTVVDKIKAEKAEVVLLQEVVPASEAVLRDSLKDYRHIYGGTGNTDGYYTAVLLHKHHTMQDDFTVLSFYASQMGRNLLVVNGSVKNVPMTVMTSHLESTKSHAEERMRQLRMSLKQMKDASSDRTVLFGGDLNVRDKEVESIGGLPAGIVDLWEATGCRKEARYTWDTFRNDNLGMEGKWRTKLRFDRLFLRQCASASRLKPVYFELVGLERLPGVQCFPSDHWGILAHFDILPMADK